MDQMNDLSAHVVIGAAVTYGIEWLKESPYFSWIHVDSTKVNRAVSVVIALVIALGIQWSGDAHAGWVITVPPLESMKGAAWEFMQQFFAQQIVYDAVLNKARPVAPLPPTPPQGETHEVHA